MSKVNECGLYDIEYSIYLQSDGVSEADMSLEDRQRGKWMDECGSSVF